ncbi:hypothetical protein BU23DRAFT_263765 [Bimuria novae-zelandiae CBS 107.79]|uniref:Uncharacterized protein n=1 Tax=Bimuria novae-zelandiae CBS 107.79 TaxID=1447943 RepID=A0A6A5UZM4_9PLEO|nr:hypothetical protein BU23DRAFT_263765 [Bimuria novae-zelandiae CBS 107.79]
MSSPSQWYWSEDHKDYYRVICDNVRRVVRYEWARQIKPDTTTSGTDSLTSSQYSTSSSGSDDEQRRSLAAQRNAPTYYTSSPAYTMPTSNPYAQFTPSLPTQAGSTRPYTLAPPNSQQRIAGLGDDLRHHGDRQNHDGMKHGDEVGGHQAYIYQRRP